MFIANYGIVKNKSLCFCRFTYYKMLLSSKYLTRLIYVMPYDVSTHLKKKMWVD